MSTSPFSEYKSAIASVESAAARLGGHGAWTRLWQPRKGKADVMAFSTQVFPTQGNMHVLKKVAADVGLETFGISHAVRPREDQEVVYLWFRWVGPITDVQGTRWAVQTSADGIEVGDITALACATPIAPAALTVTDPTGGSSIYLHEAAALAYGDMRAGRAARRWGLGMLLLGLASGAAERAAEPPGRTSPPS